MQKRGYWVTGRPFSCLIFVFRAGYLGFQHGLIHVKWLWVNCQKSKIHLLCQGAMCKRNPGDPRFSKLSLANVYILIMKNIRSCSVGTFSLEGLAGGTAAKGRRGQWLHQIGMWGVWSRLTFLPRLPADGRTDPPTLPCPQSAVHWPEITLFVNLKEVCRG